MKSLKQAEQLTGIKADNLRQRIHRGTLKATKRGRDWFVSEKQLQSICLHEHVTTPGDITTIKCAYCGKNMYQKPKQEAK